MSPEEMEKLPKKLEKIFSNLELDVMGDIVERLKETKAITPTIDWLILRMTVIGKSKTAIKKAIQKALDLAEKEIDAIYQKAAESLFARDAEIYKVAGKDFIPLTENDEALQLIDAIARQTKEEMTNITRSTGFVTRNEKGEKVVTPAAEFFQQKLDQALLEIDTGVYDYNTSIQKVIDEMTTSGLRTVEYASGRTDRVEVAARRAVMTGNSQLTDKINEKNAELLETEYWEVAWHMGARNTGTGYRNHQSWQGKVYSNEEMKTVCGLGEMLGFGGINCYHSRNPFIMGVSKRNYTDEWLEEQNEKENTRKSYRGKEYDTYAALQHQRKLERTMRKQNQDIQLLEKADAKEDALIAAQSRRRATDKEYKDFSKKMGLREQRERLAAPKRLSKTTASGLRAAGSGSGVPEHPKPQFIERLDFSDKVRVKSVLEEQERTIAGEEVENAIVVTKDGDVYRCFGNKNGVFPDADLGDRLEGAYVTHNHPINSVNEYSFSNADIQLFLQSKIAVLRGIDEKYIYELTREATEVDSHATLEELMKSDGDLARHEDVIELAIHEGFGYRRWRR